MIKISFQKQAGDPALGTLFYWKLTVQADAPTRISEHFIPELFYDFFYIQSGGIYPTDVQGCEEVALDQQSLKTIHTRPLSLALEIPLVVFGARLSLRFAETFWEPNIAANQFLPQDWIESGDHDLPSLAFRINAKIKKCRAGKTASPLLTPTLQETEWLSHFSPRHKRRLYKSVFGISKKEMRAIHGLHTFLGQTCDFSAQNPRIIEYIDSEVFYDQPHLNRWFKKLTDLSPLEYLQANSILQDNLMAASYNEIAAPEDTI